MPQVLLQECRKGYQQINNYYNGIFQNASLNAVTPENVAAGFRKDGVYPFNRNAISCPEVSDSQEDEISETKGT